jgi:putative transposase
MFRVFKISSSGYYAWTKRGPSNRQLREVRLTDKIMKYHARSRQIYGYRKVHEDLVQEEGQNCSDELVRRIMRKNGLRSKVKRKFMQPQIPGIATVSPLIDCTENSGQESEIANG